jgi:exonuclease III
MKLTEVMYHMDLTDFYRTFNPKIKEYTFSATHCTLSKIDHIIFHKIILNLCKKFEIIPYIISDHHGPSLAFNNSKSKRKLTYIGN